VVEQIFYDEQGKVAKTEAVSVLNPVNAPFENLLDI
jgi:hypothetical protein